MSGVQQAVFQNQRSFGAPLDAQFNYVTMLLHGDGTNGAQNNTFVDSSTNAFSITRNGNTTQGSFSPYGSNWSNYFGGSDYLSLADNANLNPSTQDFVMEAWVYLAGTTGNNQGINGKGTPSTDGYTFFVTNALVLSFIWNGTGGATITGGTLVLNTWNHVAVVRNSSVIRLYLNGVGAGSSTACTTDITSTATKFVGQARGGNPILGYMSNYRMTKGSLPSGYDATSSTLTVPTAPLTAISGTSLLTCQSNRFIDNSTNAFTVSVGGGTPSVQRFNPFGTATAYDTSVIGGSGYFDGSGDYLSVPDDGQFSLTTSNYTMEMWVYPTTFSAQNVPFAYGWSASGGDRLIVFVQNTNATYQVYYNNASVNFITSNTVKLNAWNHLALVRNGNVFTFYINGVSDASNTVSTTYPDSPWPIIIGGSWSGSTGDFFYSGYISDVRVCVGTAVYTSGFTPPTAPLTAITNTVLLANMTNGAIFDNAMMNDLETVGNAQISTSVVKYGTGSLAFDGTGDSLVGPSNVNYAFGTGNFTVEGWFYQTANNNYPVAFEVGNHFTSTGIVFITRDNSAGGVDAKIYSGGFFGSTATTLNAWNHIAWVRSSGVLQIYVNGTGGTSIAFTNNLTDSSWTVVGSTKSASETSYLYTGYMDDLRITKGYARYTANFTPPTAAFSNTGPY